MREVHHLAESKGLSEVEAIKKLQFEQEQKFADPINSEMLENLEELINQTDKLKQRKLESDMELKDKYPKLYMASKLNEAIQKK